MALSIEEEKILESIVVPSYNHPSKPEFPHYAPKFPASKTFQIEVPGFDDVWLKDESVHRYSGTHKDRLAWEVVILYRDFLMAKKIGRTESILPQFSMITSGSAGLAIGRSLRAFGLPKLKVLINKNLKDKLKNALLEGHCEIYPIELDEKPLTPEQILEKTENTDGFDLTSNQGMSLEIGNYDWMGYEILNENADFVFIPFGTGIIFRKVLELSKMEISSFGHQDPRFKGNSKKLQQCSYLGATSYLHDTKADKLYAPFRPFKLIDGDWVKFYKRAAYCGPFTEILGVEEEFIIEGYKMAREKGINCEHSGAAGLALLLQLQDKIPHDKKILIINTGRLKLDEKEVVV